MLWWRRHREPDNELRSPREQLWEELKDFFVDEDGSRYAGPLVGFDEVATADVERLWNHIASRATSIDDPNDIPDELGSLSAHEAVNLFLEERLPYLSFSMSKGCGRTGGYCPTSGSRSIPTGCPCIGLSDIQKTIGTERRSPGSLTFSARCGRWCRTPYLSVSTARASR